MNNLNEKLLGVLLFVTALLIIYPKPAPVQRVAYFPPLRAVSANAVTPKEFVPKKVDQRVLASKAVAPKILAAAPTVKAQKISRVRSVARAHVSKRIPASQNTRSYRLPLKLSRR